jgi:Ca-activated chloride channel homolog
MLRRKFLSATTGLAASGLVVPPALLAQGAPAQQQAPAATPPQAPAQTPERDPIRVEVNEVIVAVTVTDEKGRFVADLNRNDFKVLDSGKEQKISYFTRERNQPVVVGFLVDLSNASRLHWKNYKDAAEELIYTLLPTDREKEKRFAGYLISYANDAELQVNTTNDPEKLVEKVRKMKPGGGSAMYDAVWLACTSRSLVKGEPFEPRRVVVIVGDGNDNASKHTLDQVIEIAQKNLVTVYGISTVAYGFDSSGEKNLTRLCEETGGRVVYPLEGVYKDVTGYLEKPSDEGNYAIKVGTGGYASAIAQNLFRSIAAVSGEITTQYIIRYIPDVGEDAKQQFRNISVAVTLPNVKVRARKGYYPSATP